MSPDFLVSSSSSSSPPPPPPPPPCYSPSYSSSSSTPPYFLLLLLILLLLLPLALQPAVGFGLSNKILPFFPICHQLPPSSLNPSSFFLYSTFVTIKFLLCGIFSPTPNRQPGGPAYPFLSVSSPLTCLACEARPVAYATASRALGIM
jgi:hypothetical protein